MSTQNISDDALGSALFPEYMTLYDLISQEVEGLTDEQLDWTSDKWGWSEWSIRRQVSHMGSLLYRWLINRWGDVLFPDGNHGIDDVEGIAKSNVDRAMDDERYHDLSAILEKLKQGIDLVQRALNGHDVAFLRSHTISHERSPQWIIMYRAHPTGIEPASAANAGKISLEATIRHMYFEEITHLYNIQRLKRAQGLPTNVEVPRVGYWVLDGWDRSEP